MTNEIQYGPRGFPICPLCGWQMVVAQEHEAYPSRCYPESGAAAKALAAASSVPTTMHGYGAGRLTFKFDEDRNLTLVMNGQVASIDHLHWLGEMDADEVIFMVNKIAEVAKHLRDRRAGKVPA